MEDFKKLYEKAEEELAEAKADLTEKADKLEDQAKELAQKGSAWVKSNGRLIGIAAGVLVVGFALGAALV